MVETSSQQTGGVGFAVTSLVTGIVGLLLGFFFWMSLPLATVAITFGALGLRRKEGRGMAIAGLVTGCLAALAGLLVVLIAIVSIAIEPSYPEYYYY